MISHQHEFIFVHVGRTGGSSLERLAGIALTSDMRTAPSGNTDFPNKHSTLNYYYQRHPEEYSNYFKFTIVRNPFERMVSAWFWRCNIVRDHNCSLLEFARSRPDDWAFQNRLKLDHLSFSESINQLDFVARYENFDTDLRYICEQKGLDYSKCPHTNKTNHRNYQDYYNKQSHDFVYRRYRTEIEFFDYQFNQ